VFYAYFCEKILPTMFLENSDYKNITNYLTCLLLVLSLVSAWWIYYDYQLLIAYYAGKAENYDLQANNVFRFIFVIFYGTVWAGAGIAFIGWLSLVYQNLKLSNAKQAYNEHWAIWSWFVPFMNLLVPYQILHESHKKLQLLRHETVLKTLPSLDFWWVFFIISFAVDRVSGYLITQVKDYGDVIDAVILSIVSEVLSIISFVLFFLMVRAISKQESKTYQYLQNVQEIEPNTETI
jgi:hypothetical protein